MENISFSHFSMLKEYGPQLLGSPHQYGGKWNELYETVSRETFEKIMFCAAYKYHNVTLYMSYVFPNLNLPTFQWKNQQVDEEILLADLRKYQPENCLYFLVLHKNIIRKWPEEIHLCRVYYNVEFKFQMNPERKRPIFPREDLQFARICAHCYHEEFDQFARATRITEHFPNLCRDNCLFVKDIFEDIFWFCDICKFRPLFSYFRPRDCPETSFGCDDSISQILTMVQPKSLFELAQNKLAGSYSRVWNSVHESLPEIISRSIYANAWKMIHQFNDKFPEVEYAQTSQSIWPIQRKIDSRGVPCQNPWSPQNFINILLELPTIIFPTRYESVHVTMKYLEFETRNGKLVVCLDCEERVYNAKIQKEPPFRRFKHQKLIAETFKEFVFDEENWCSVCLFKPLFFINDRRACVYQTMYHDFYRTSCSDPEDDQYVSNEEKEERPKRFRK